MCEDLSSQELYSKNQLLIIIPQIHKKATKEKTLASMLARVLECLVKNKGTNERIPQRTGGVRSSQAAVFAAEPRRKIATRLITVANKAISPSTAIATHTSSNPLARPVTLLVSSLTFLVRLPTSSEAVLARSKAVCALPPTATRPVSGWSSRSSTTLTRLVRMTIV